MSQPSPKPPDAENLVRRALELPADQREAFLASHVCDEAQRRAIAERLTRLDQTEVVTLGTETPPNSATDSANASGTGDDPTVALEQGSTQHGAPPETDPGDMLPTIDAGSPQGDRSDDSIGQIGEYELLEEVARGGMGVVFKARHRVLDRLVAIKIPRAAQLEDEGEARFLREARAAAQLRHPHICPIYEVGHAGRQPFIALGFIDGPTLRQKLASKIKARDAAEIMAKVAAAVHYAHEHGVIHRDIKPSNIMLDAEAGEPVLMDFGLAKQLSEGDSLVTKSGQVMGTPVYMAPEQAAGRHDQIGPKTDVYSLGAVLYELLTGEPPFAGPTGEVIRQVQTDEPPAPRKIAPAVHRDLETICLKAMAKEPAARYASAQALADDLDRFAAGEAILAKREAIARRCVRVLRRHAALVAAVLLMAIVGGAIASYFALGAREASQIAAINRQFNEGLQAVIWDAPHRQQMESLAMELEPLDPDAAVAMRQQLYKTFSGHVRNRIVTPAALTEVDFEQLEAGIAWLRRRDGNAATTLAQQLDARRRTWQTLFALGPPYENRDDVFVNGEVDLHEEGLKRDPEKSLQEPVVITRVASSGNVRLTARFAADWKNAQEIALLVHSDKSQGYTFRLRAPALARRNPRAVPPGGQRFWHHMEIGGKIDVEILRDGLLLRHASMRANDLADQANGELTLEATAEGERLSFRVGRQPALTFEDIFPVVGGLHQKFGLRLPPEATLVSLTAMQQPLPSQPSRFEEGDQLFAEQQWTAALSQYQQQAGLASDESLRARAKFKEALCLVHLDEDGDAAVVLESVMSTDDERLRLLAACQIWLLHLRHARYADAEVVFESLKSQYDFEQLALLVPEADRRDIIDKTYGATTGLNLYRFTDDKLRFLQQAHQVRQLLNPNPNANERGMQTWQFLRALHIVGEIDRAVQLVQEYRRDGVRLDENMAISIISEGSWLLRQRGQYDKARAMIDMHLGDRGRADPSQLQLLVERARIMAAQAEWDKAAEDLDFFLASDHCRDNYREFSAACMMRGLLHQRAGEMEDAQRLWHRGLHENWLAELDQQRQSGPSLTGMQAAHALLLGALCGDRTEKQVIDAVSQSFPISNSGVTAQLARQYSHVLAPAIANMGKSERGREVIWRVAFWEAPLKQLIREPANLIFLEMTRLGAAPGDWTPEEEQIVWDMMNAGFELYSTDEIGMPQAVQFMLTWKGSNNLFGWKGLAPSLDPLMRGPAAYVFGHRFVRLGKHRDAAEFFQTAINDAEADSKLHKLATDQLAELNAGTDN